MFCLSFDASAISSVFSLAAELLQVPVASMVSPVEFTAGTGRNLQYFFRLNYKLVPYNVLHNEVRYNTKVAE